MSLDCTGLWPLIPTLFSFWLITPHLASANFTFIILLRESLLLHWFFNIPPPPFHSWNFLFQALITCLLHHCLCLVPPLPWAPIHFSWPCWQRQSSQNLLFDLLRILQSGPLTCRIRSELLIQANKTLSDLPLNLPQLLEVKWPTPLLPHKSSVQLTVLPLLLAYTVLQSFIWHFGCPQDQDSSTPSSMPITLTTPPLDTRKRQAGIPYPSTWLPCIFHHLLVGIAPSLYFPKF